MNTTRIPPAPMLKQAAKEAMQKAGLAMIKVTFVYIGLTLIVNYALQGTIPEDKYLLGIGLTLLINLLLNLVQFGYQGLCLDCARGEEELPVSGLLAGTHLPLRVFGLYILSTLLIFVQSFPYMLALMLGMVALSYLGVFGIFLMSPVVIWYLWSVIKVAARYVLAPMVLWDRPEMPAMDCLNLSRTMMQGHEGKYIWLIVSFIGWLLLSAVTMGIASMYVTPYMGVTLAMFYRALGGDKIAGLAQKTEENPGQQEDLRDAFTTSAYRDSEDK